MIALTQILLAALMVPGTGTDELQTVAERSNYQATSRHVEVVDFCHRLAGAAPVVRVGVMGTTVEGRKLPLIILADPPLSTPEEAARSGKLVVFAMGNIHAGEVDAKEGLLMLAREIAMGTERRLLKDLVVLIAPIFNADGNERMSKANRPSQVGPADGMGVRANAQGLDLNRDFVKLESPEVRSLVRLLDKWDPAVFIDGHTTNGSHHRYILTYESPRNPAGDRRVIEFARDTLLPDVGRRLEKLDGYHSFFYGNFERGGHQLWESVPPTPRFSTHYTGLRNRIGILSESYSYAPYKDRCLASRDFARCIFEYVAENKDRVRKLLDDVRATTIREGKKPEGSVPLRQKLVPLNGPFTFLGYEEDQRAPQTPFPGRPRDYPVQFLGRSIATLEVPRPWGYLFPPSYTRALENLQRHGIAVDQLREEVEMDVEIQQVATLESAPRAFQKHRTVLATTRMRKESRRVPAGTVLVKTGQPLGALAAYLLEPQAEDGLTTWNFFDEGLGVGKDSAVLRLPARAPVTTVRVRPLPEDRTMSKPVTFDAVYTAGPPLDFGGSPVSGLVWLDDGEHFLQAKAGRLYKVQAATGRCETFGDADQMAGALAAIAGMDKVVAGTLAHGTTFRMDPQRAGALLDYNGNLYYARFDGTRAVRLTKTAGNREHATFSPDGKWLAFVLGGDLHALDLAAQTDHRLTSDGSRLVSNGKPDWVYGEEIYGYQKTYWWSPDSTQIAFLRCDDHPVSGFTVIDNVPNHQLVETTAYPKSGEPNPTAKLGIVAAAGGPIRWVDLPGYAADATLITRAGWWPDGHGIYVYLQDRAQTWLDFCAISREGGALTRLFRETTPAWVDEPGEPHFLRDGSFLLASERTGWKHFYHRDPRGKLLGAVTAGNWEARTLHRVDEDAGCVYLSGTRDNPIGLNLYRFRLDGSSGDRLTPGPGDHQVTVAPRGALFIDSHSSHDAPTRVELRGGGGVMVRTLDSNPVYIIEEHRLGRYQPLKVKADDGFEMEASLMTPPNFDPSRRYPVWFMTYGGPHAPTIHDSWQGGRVRDQVLAAMGFVVFRCDPRSASGKGIAPTWTSYRRLGVGELKDVEAAIRWLTKQPYVDPARVGMSGHSFGGFLTAYALTHSTLFAAGVAGAPVTDWRTYDTIYTERYMNTPALNRAGYDETSVVKAAAHLHGKLLILHGLFDDNVHVQNTLQLIDTLQRADKSFEVMFYPRYRHRLMGTHYQRLMIDFMRRALQPTP